MLPHKLRCFAMSGATLLVCLGAERALAAGYWNVPSSWAQHMGYGNGGGYHAPFVLGPPNCRGYFRHNHYRVPYAPTARPYGNRCATCGESFASPTVLEPTPAPTPVVVRTTRTSRPLFLR
jgi:hypothetical protein